MASRITDFLLWFYWTYISKTHLYDFKWVLTKKIHEMTSPAILAWGGSSSFSRGIKFFDRHDSKRLTRAAACFSIVPLSLFIVWHVHWSQTISLKLIKRSHTEWRKWFSSGKFQQHSDHYAFGRSHWQMISLGSDWWLLINHELSTCRRSKIDHQLSISPVKNRWVEDNFQSWQPYPLTNLFRQNFSE